MNIRTRWPLAAFMFAVATQAHAAVFIVTNNADVPDITPGDGICNIAPPGPPPVCTLRAAMMEANVFATPDEIIIPANMLITLTTFLPTNVNPLVIRGLGNLFDASSLPRISGNNSFRIFIASGSSFELRTVQLTNAVTSGRGAALALEAGVTAIVDGVRIFDTSADNGGAISIVNGSSASVRRTAFDLNRATVAGGAIWLQGGTTSLNLSSSSIRRWVNDSSTAEAISASNGATVTISNTLIDGADNQPAGTQTSGLVASAAGDITIENSTFRGFSLNALRILAPSAPDQIRVRNSIFAGSTLPDCVFPATNGATVVFGYNLIEDNSCAAVSGIDVITGDPVLGPSQADPGSFVRYREPVLGSQVIDAASPANGVQLGACVSTDQRGTPRPLDGNADTIARCDLGAIEASEFTSTTFVVNYGITDSVDANPGDGICATSNPDRCTLRAAVMEANAKPGPDRILFELPGGGTAINLNLAAAAGADGGDLDIIEALSIDGGLIDGRPAINVVQFRNDERLFEVNGTADQSVAFRGLILRSGEATSVSGGALRITGGAEVSVDTVELYDNQSAIGGGAISVVNGSLVLLDSDLHDNSTDDLGAALYIGEQGSASVRRSSFWNNTDTSPGVGASREAIHLATGASLRLGSSTVSFNSGGIQAVQPGNLNIVQSTITHNDDRGLFVAFGAADDQLTLRSSIFSENGLAECFLSNAAAADSLETDSYNLFNGVANTCNGGPTNLIGDPLLLVNPAPNPLTQPQGRLSRGLVPFSEPIAPSPALDAVPRLGLSCESYDHRGVSRPQDLSVVPNAATVTCDIGAVEVEQEALPDDVIFADGFD